MLGLNGLVALGSMKIKLKLALKGTRDPSRKINGISNKEKIPKTTRQTPQENN
jgi:hypothetical protein